jgi:DNA-directed RNA polymerase specialized sigma subunit
VRQTQNDIPPVSKELEAEADRLLRESGATNHRCGMEKNEGIYTEVQLRDHYRREFTNNDIAFQRSIEIAEIEERDMVLDDVKRLCEMSGMSDEQMLIWTLYHQGMTQSDIAEILQTSRQSIHSRLQRCQCRLMRTIAQCWWFGWYEVYLSEVNRRD